VTDLPQVFEQLQANPGQGLPDLADYLARTGRWFTYHKAPAVLREDGELVTIATLQDVQNLIGSDIIPVRNLQGNRPPFGAVLRADIPKLIFAEFCHNGSRYFPLVDRVVQLPAFGVQAGAFCPAAPGYDPVTKAVYIGTVTDPECPQNEDFPHLKQWLSGLTFESPIHHANTLGLMAAMLCRSAIARFPLVLIEANTHSAGKTTLAQAMGYLLAGELPEGMSYTGNEESFERNLSNYANRPGPNFILIDNVRKKHGNASIRSMTLARSITGHVLGFRALYKGTVGLFDPIFVVTMNDAQVEADLADKVISIRLKRPEHTAHKLLEPNPLDYAIDHRRELLAELLHLVSALECTKHGARFTRFYEVEALVYQAARRLGLEASFDPERVSTTSAIVQEVVYMLDYVDKFSFGQPVDLQAMADTAQAQPNDYKELGATLLASSIPSKGRGKRLAQILRFSINDMVFTLPDGRRFLFEVSGDDKLTVTERTDHEDKRI